jgi:hypothetical protein
MNLPLNYNAVGYGNRDSNLRNGHMAVTHNWNLKIIPDKLNPPDLWSMLTELIDGNNGIDDLNINCQNVTPPNNNVTTVEGNVRGVRFHQIANRSSTPIQTQLTFYEPADFRIYSFFERWKSATVSRDSAAQNPDAKISDGVSLILYTHDRKMPVIEYLLYETYCSAAQINDPASQGNLQNCSVTLQSSNYGIKVFDLTDGRPSFVNVPQDMLGRAEFYRTAWSNTGFTLGASNVTSIHTRGYTRLAPEDRVIGINEETVAGKTAEDYNSNEMRVLA